MQIGHRIYKHVYTCPHPVQMQVVFFLLYGEEVGVC